MKRFAALVYCARPKVIAFFLVGEATILLYALWGGPGFSWDTWLAATLRVCAALAPLMAAGFIMNDLVDVEIDRANGRTLHTEIAGAGLARAVLVALFIAAVAASFATGAGFTALILADAVALVLYNLVGKRVVWLKAVLVPAIIVTIYPLAYLAAPWRYARG